MSIDRIRDRINDKVDWREWLDFKEVFKDKGNQGIVGLFNVKNDDDKDIVFKFSQHINDIILHENIVMSGLNDLSLFCPHFCQSYGVMDCKIRTDYYSNKTPFEYENNHYTHKHVLFMEYIKTKKLFYYIHKKGVNENILYSVIKQVLLAISIAQRQKKFTHNDLHSDNIMMKRCNKNDVFLYILDDSNQFCVPTLGYYPVIIDFGFSYISDMEDKPLFIDLSQTDAGFMSDRFDWVADPKLFLVTISDQIKFHRKSKKSLRLRRVVRNLFFPLKIDWQRAWDNTEEMSAINYVIEILNNYNNKFGSIFRRQINSCADLLQSLIILPLEKREYKDIGKLYKIWLDEWCKIEDEFTKDFEKMYVLQGVIEAARIVRPDYIDIGTREIAISEFRNKVHDRVNHISKFCKFRKSINFEKMLCSLYLLTKCVEGILYIVMTVKMGEKEKLYKKLPLQSVEQIYAAISSNIPDEYVYNKNTVVHVLDCVKKTRKSVKLERDVIDEVNNIHHLCRGTYLYDKMKLG